MPSSQVWATDIEVLPVDRRVERRTDHWVIRSPSNPGHFWGNLLVFDDPPGLGDGERWPACFDTAFADEPRVRHCTLAWDRTDGAVGEADRELVARGFELEVTTGLVARPGELCRHPRENREVRVRQLDPRLGGHDEPLWEQVLEIWAAGRDEGQESEESYRRYALARLADLRVLFGAGKGAWYVALEGEQAVASCGIVVAEARGRFQAVDTLETHRRRGICSRLLVAAAAHAAARHELEWLVIAADPGYHAIGLYESIGFVRAETVTGAMRKPAS